MSDSFFSRWSRQKSLQRDLDQAREQAITTPAPPAHPVPTTGTLPADLPHPAPRGVQQPLDEAIPTLEDTQALEVGADVSRFLRDGVSDAVKGAALKKLFADPAYNVISDMDDYVEDYSKMATMTKLEVSKLQQSKDLYLFEDPPWKVQAEAQAKAQAKAQEQEQEQAAAASDLAADEENNKDQSHGDVPVLADNVHDSAVAAQPTDTGPDEGATTHRQTPP